MHRFWPRFIGPLIEAAAPQRMLEIGAEFGWNTAWLLEYCRRTGCFLDVVDPVPHPSLHEVLGRFPSEHRFHPLKSLNAIPLLPAADLVLLDGDHNYFTVYRELQNLFARAIELRTVPPLIVMHDMAWPYARRDMYYDPDPIPFGERHPFAARGIVPGQSELSDEGLNGHFFNALHEGGPNNGVLTAAEDFVTSWPGRIGMHVLPFFNGLGILVPEGRGSAAVDAVIEGFFSAGSLMETCAALELDGMKVRVEAAGLRLQVTQRNEALSRLRARVLAAETEAADLRRRLGEG
jgi:hypothetical protein